jgi:hypothetical protein
MKLKVCPQELVPESLRSSGHMKLLNSQRAPSFGESYTTAHAEFARAEDRSEGKYGRF